MRKYLAIWMMGLVMVLVLAACTPIAPAAPTEAPATAAEPTATTAEPTAAATVEPTTAATATTASTAEPTASAEPTAESTATEAAATTGEAPDPQSDPMAALLYAGSAETMKSAEFEYEMSMTMEPADDAAAEALGRAAELLKAFEMRVTGSGAVEVVDPQGMNNKMRMQLEMEAAGQQMQMEMVMIEDTLWARTGADEEWKKSELDPDELTVLGGMGPNDMLESFQNATDVEWVEDTELNGEPVSHLRFTMDPSQFDLSSLTSRLGESSSSAEIEQIMQDMTIEADVWLAQDDLELREQRMLITVLLPAPEAMGNADVRIRMLMDTIMRMQNINEPVTIEPPTE